MVTNWGGASSGRMLARCARLARPRACRSRALSGGAGEARVLWKPDTRASAASNMSAFARFVEQRERVAVPDYDALHAWSVADVGKFWGALWDFCDVRCSAPYTSVVDDPRRMPGARWFAGARLNFAENLLRHGSPAVPASQRARLAYIAYDETSTGARTWTYEQLWDDVSDLARALRAAGVRPGDRVAGVLPNTPESAIAMLASVAVGASWASCSPEFGVDAVVDRLAQVRPRVLFAVDTTFYRGKRIALLDKLKGITAKLAEEGTPVPLTVLSPYTWAHEPAAELPALPSTEARAYHELVREAAAQPDRGALEFAQRAFDDEVYIMFSSGTTGRPKCMAQGAGVLLQHLKELVLHTDLRADERVFYFSTLAWMMWNWSTSALATGATLVTYDGDPAYPTPDRLWRMAAEARLNVFGTSARYLAAQQAAGVALEPLDLPHLRAILSTGSPASDGVFEYAARAGGRPGGVQLASICGGTDLNGCFALGNPLLPVRVGELQCLGLGMDVAIFDHAGDELPAGTRGELVCRQAFPSMPLRFLGDDGEDSRYRAAYFEEFGGTVWCHGDFAERTHSGGVIVHGRSDATLNPGGVRIGTADIYRVLEAHVRAVEDAVVVGQDCVLPDGTPDVRVLLFVKMPDGGRLTDALEAEIRTAIRTHASPRHVPARVLVCDDIPYTTNGKKVEVAVKRAIDGQVITNRAALANPESLAFFEAFGAAALDGGPD